MIILETGLTKGIYSPNGKRWRARKIPECIHGWRVNLSLAMKLPFPFMLGFVDVQYSCSSGILHVKISIWRTFANLKLWLCLCLIRFSAGNHAGRYIICEIRPPLAARGCSKTPETAVVSLQGTSNMLSITISPLRIWCHFSMKAQA